jgi:hypothetical protein
VTHESQPGLERLDLFVEVLNLPPFGGSYSDIAALQAAIVSLLSFPPCLASANAQQCPLSASAGQSAFSQLHSPLARNSALTGAPYVPRHTAWIVRTA